MARQAFEMPVGDRRYADPRLPGGGGGVEHQHGNDMSTYTPDPSELDRYRGMGEAAAKRGAYQIDYSKALGDEAQGLQSRDAQVAGLNNMRQAAMGGAPSQAATLGNQAAGQSLQAQMAAGANARGMGQAAAQMQAAQGVGAQQLGAMGQYAGMRGNEMQHAQQAYGQAGGAMRTGDYAQQGMAQGRAEAQGQMELGQRQLNQGAQMQYEQMGINDQQQNVDAQARIAAMQAQANADAQASHDARNARNLNGAIAGMSAIGSFGTSVANPKSDERAKQNVTMLSDDRTKLAAAWEEGNKAAVSDAQTLRTKSPEELKRYAAGGNRMAAVVRDAKADTYDEARGAAHPTEKRQPVAVARAAMGSVQRADPAEQNRNNAISETNLSRADMLESAGGGIGTAAAGILRNRDADYQRTRMVAPPPPIGERMQDGMADMMSHAYPEPNSSQDGPISMSDERGKQAAHAEGEMGRALEQGYKPFEYEYKPGFREQEGQRPGEKNVGPMAQNMAQNPITGNAVEEGPDGLLRISIPKTVKTNSAGIGYLAAKTRKLEDEIAQMKGGR